MKTKIFFKMLLLTIVFIATAQQASAQLVTANDWKGTWHTNFGELSLDHKMTNKKTEVFGSLGNFEIKGTIHKSEFTGQYSIKRGLNITPDPKLNKSGLFKITMDFNKKAFSGNFTPANTKKEVEWQGSRDKNKTFITRKEVPKVNNNGMPRKPPTNTTPIKWTGTWELTGKDQGLNPTIVPRTMKVVYHNEENIEVQFYDFFPAKGEIFNLQKVKLSQMHSSTGYSGYEYFMVGKYKFPDGKTGRIEFRLDKIQDPGLNTMSGVIMYPQNSTGSTGYGYGENINVKGKRLSSKKPDFNNFTQTN